MPTGKPRERVGDRRTVGMFLRAKALAESEQGCPKRKLCSPKKDQVSDISSGIDSGRDCKIVCA